jgi:hypothetical protein
MARKELVGLSPWSRDRSNISAQPVQVTFQNVSSCIRPPACSSALGFLCDDGFSDPKAALTTLTNATWLSSGSMCSDEFSSILRSFLHLKFTASDNFLPASGYSSLVKMSHVGYSRRTSEEPKYLQTSPTCPEEFAYINTYIERCSYARVSLLHIFVFIYQDFLKEIYCTTSFRRSPA